MHPIEKRIYIIVGLLIIFSLGWRFTEKNEQPVNIVPTKIDSVPYIKPIAPKITNNYSTHTTYQTVIDTSKRKEAEKEPILLGVEIKKREVTIQKIDSSGKITEEKHTVEEGSTVTIDNKNFNEKKQSKTGKLLRKVGKVALRTLEVIGGVCVVVTTIKSTI
jgi:hypothetical protein